VTPSTTHALFAGLLRHGFSRLPPVNQDTAQGARSPLESRARAVWVGLHMEVIPLEHHIVVISKDLPQ